MVRLTRRNMVAGACGAAMMAALTSPALAQTAVKIGVLTDVSGTYADPTGNGSIWAAKKAIEDFKPETKGLKVEIISADPQNKPDIGVNIARKWVDTENVDVIVDVPTSSVALRSDVRRVGPYVTSRVSPLR